MAIFLTGIAALVSVVPPGNRSRTQWQQLRVPDLRWKWRSLPMSHLAGQVFRFTTPDQQLVDVAVPAGAKPGSKMAVCYQPTAPAQQYQDPIFAAPGGGARHTSPVRS
jgi:hypothetical protein